MTTTLTLPIWALILLIGYSLLFTGLFVMALAAMESEKAAHERSRIHLKKEVSYFCRRMISAKRYLSQLQNDGGGTGTRHLVGKYVEAMNEVSRVRQKLRELDSELLKQFEGPKEAS